MANLVPVVIGTLMVTVVVLLVKMKHLGVEMNNELRDHDVVKKAMQNEQKETHTRFLDAKYKAGQAEEKIKQLDQHVTELNDVVSKQDQDLAKTQHSLELAQEEINQLHMELEEQKKTIMETENIAVAVNRNLEEKTNELQKVQENIRVYEHNAQACEGLNNDLKNARELLAATQKEADMWKAEVQKNAEKSTVVEKAPLEDGAKNEVKRSLTTTLGEEEEGVVTESKDQQVNEEGVVIDEREQTAADENNEEVNEIRTDVKTDEQNDRNTEVNNDETLTEVNNNTQTPTDVNNNDNQTPTEVNNNNNQTPTEVNNNNNQTPTEVNNNNNQTTPTDVNNVETKSTQPDQTTVNVSNV